MTSADTLRTLRQALLKRRGQLVASLLERSTSPGLERRFAQVQQRIAAVRSALARDTQADVGRTARERARAGRRRLAW